MNKLDGLKRKMGSVWASLSTRGKVIAVAVMGISIAAAAAQGDARDGRGARRDGGAITAPAPMASAGDPGGAPGGDEGGAWGGAPIAAPSWGGAPSGAPITAPAARDDEPSLAQSLAQNSARQDYAFDRAERIGVRGDDLYTNPTTGETYEAPVAPNLYQNDTTGELVPTELPAAPAGGDYTQLTPSAPSLPSATDPAE